jgi:hypothetical protein
MIRIVFLVSFSIFSFSFSKAQKSSNKIIDLKHATYLELGGTAGIWSLNYDLMFMNISNFKVGARLGLGMLGEGYSGTTVDVHIPITVNFMYAFHKNHHIELGVGTQIRSYEIRSVQFAADTGFVRKSEALGNFSFGYRFQSPDGGFVFRACYSPFFYQDGIYFRYEHWAGLSLGYAFNRGKKSKKSKTE